MLSGIRGLSDKLSISLSLLCAIHCLAVPVLMVVLPTAFALPLEGEAFHLWMAMVVIPLSAFALFMGCRQHKTTRVAVVGVLGVVALGMAAVFGHDYLGEVGEKVVTVLAACMIALAHYWNYKLCSHGSDCDCTKHG